MKDLLAQTAHLLTLLRAYLTKLACMLTLVRVYLTKLACMLAPVRVYLPKLLVLTQTSCLLDQFCFSLDKLRELDSYLPKKSQVKGCSSVFKHVQVK